MAVASGEPWSSPVADALREAGHMVDRVATLAEVDPLHCAGAVVGADDIDAGVRTALGVPMLALVPDARPAQRARALRCGADDCVAVSAPLREIVVRVERLAAHRSADRATRSIVVGPLEVDVDRRVARVDGRQVTVTTPQMNLLVELAGRAGEVVPVRRLVAVGWDAHQDVDRSLLRPQLARLRRALGADVAIRSQRGAGYVLDVPMNRSAAGPRGS